jgi:hypothetical protein
MRHSKDIYIHVIASGAIRSPALCIVESRRTRIDKKVVQIKEREIAFVAFRGSSAGAYYNKIFLRDMI